MKTNLRQLLFCAAIAGFVPLTIAALADNPPAEKAPSTSAPAAPSAPASPETQSPSASTPVAAPASTSATPAPATSAPPVAAEEPDPASAAKSEPALRPLDQAPATAGKATETDEPSRSTVRPPRRRSSESERVTIGGNAVLGKNEVACTVVAVAGNATSEGEVTDSVVAVIGKARVTGPVSNAVVAVLGDVYVDSKVGEVVAVLGNVELGPNAEVRGNVVSVAGTVKRDPRAIVHGSVPNVSFGHLGFSADWLQSYLRNCILKGRPLAIAPDLGWAWVIAIGFLLFYILLGLLFGRSVETCARTLETRPGGTLLAALLAVLLLPVLVVLLCITVVGIAVVPFLAIGIKAAGLFGKAVILAWIGRRITTRLGEGPLTHPSFAILLGGLIVLALYLVPFVGFMVHMLLSFVGFGAVVYTIVLASKREKTVPPVTPVHTGAAAVPPGFSGPAGSASAAAMASETGVATGIAVPAVSSGVATAALPRAGFWIRIGALMIDVILVGIVALALPRALHLEFPGFLLMIATYGAILWKLKGTTIGGIICGLRVVRTDGREIDWATALVRALGCFLSLVVLGLGFIWIAIDDEKQSWHDKIAGTTVVFARGSVSLV